ncbi:MAG: hypothetical protein IKP04_00725 [Candidatus Methanomethylophilaceae archaeon]|nr:hypothetical protein [Candidatus Methanomethylophilaceae archaeon]
MNKNDGRDFADYVQSMRDCQSRIKELECLKNELEGLEQLINETDSLLKKYKGLADETTELFLKRDYPNLNIKLTGLPDSIQSLEEVLDKLKGTTAVEQQHVKRRTELLTFCFERMRSDDITKTREQGQQLLHDIEKAAAEARAEAKRLQIQREEAEWRERERRRIESRLWCIKESRKRVIKDVILIIGGFLITAVVYNYGRLCFASTNIFRRILGVGSFLVSGFICLGLLIGLIALFEAIKELKEAKAKY